MGTLQSLAIGQRHSVCSKRGKISKTHFLCWLVQMMAQHDGN